jgi:hypothetical protein
LRKVYSWLKLAIYERDSFSAPERGPNAARTVLRVPTFTAIVHVPKPTYARELTGEAARPVFGPPEGDRPRIRN